MRAGKALKLVSLRGVGGDLLTARMKHDRTTGVLNFITPLTLSSSQNASEEKCQGGQAMSLCKDCLYKREKNGERTDQCDRAFSRHKSYALMDGHELIGCTGGVNKEQLEEEK